jgi:hypothetical protein
LNRKTRIAAIALTLAATAGLSAQASAAEPTELVRWHGDTSSATGNALGQGACDLNGDGRDDAVVGAWFWDKAPNNNTGAAYVLFGGERASGGDLNTPASAGAVRIDGPAVANAFVGFSTACVGDVNGDGIDDMGISYYTQEKAYVVLGAEEFGSVDLGLLGDRGFEIEGDLDFSYNVGNSMAGAGDVNGDGLEDIAVGAIAADTLGRTNNGRIWIVAGKEDVADVQVVDDTGETPDSDAVLAIIDGAGDQDRIGQGGLSPAGDFDGDGIDDFVAGAYAATPRATDTAVPGAAWVIRGDESWGDAATTNRIDTASIGTAGVEVFGPARQRDRLGTSASDAGDLNGDGFDDVIVGGDGVYNAATGQRPGGAWVVFGSDSTERIYTDAAPAATAVYRCTGGGDGAGGCDPANKVARGYWIQGADSDPGTTSESTGFSLDAIGDVNADDIEDFAIGAWAYDPPNPGTPGSTLANAGAVWVVHGKSSTTTQDLATLTPAEGYRVDGLAAGDRFGRSVGALGDFDGNGTDDWAAGADMAARPLPPGSPRTQAGEVAIALMGTPGSSTELTATPAGPVLAEDPVKLDATVIADRTGDPAESGTVTFSADGNAISGCADLAVENGDAGCTATFAAPGSYEIVASYSGGPALGPSDSAPELRLVNARPPAETPPSDTGTPPPAGAAVKFESPPKSPQRLRRSRAAVKPFGLTCSHPTGCALDASARVIADGESFGVRALFPPKLAQGESAILGAKLSKAARAAVKRARGGKLVLSVSVSAGGETTGRDLAVALRSPR